LLGHLLKEFVKLTRPDHVWPRRQLGQKDGSTVTNLAGVNTMTATDVDDSLDEDDL